MIALLQRWKTRLAPFETSLLEAFLIRLGLAIAVWILFPLQTYPGEPHPNGLALLLPGENFIWLHDDGVRAICRWMMAAALVLYVAHRMVWLAYPVIVGLLVASGTLTNSQSAEVTHHSQIVTLVLLGQGVWWFVGAMGRGRTLESARRWHMLAVFFSMQIIMSGYMVSVVSKMVYSDGRWIAKAANIPVQLEKNQLMDHYNVVNLPEAERLAAEARAKRGWLDRLDLPERAQALVIGHPNVARLAMTTGMLLELFCFLALLGRRQALVYGVFLILFHLIISWTMNLTFKYHIALLALYFVGIPHWLTVRLPERWRNPGILSV